MIFLLIGILFLILFLILLRQEPRRFANVLLLTAAAVMLFIGFAELTQHVNYINSLFVFFLFGIVPLVMPLTGTKSYLVEVPAGTQLMSNGTAVSADRMVQSAVSASGFDGVYNTSLIPSVDIYQLDGLLGIPSLTDGSGTPYSLVEDVLTGNLIAGTAVQDDAVLNLIIADGETLASYPAKDVALSAVSTIADPSALWYQRYVTLQNTWFTPHARRGGGRHAPG